MIFAPVVAQLQNKMVASLIRESAFGQFMRLISGKRIFKYPEEIDPTPWIEKYGPEATAKDRQRPRSPPSDDDKNDEKDEDEKDDPEFKFTGPYAKDTAPAPYVPRGPESAQRQQRQYQSDASRHNSGSTSRTRVGSEDESEKGKNSKSKNGDEEEKGKDYTLVEFDENDPENPMNWSHAKKFFVTFEICLLTFGVYIGSAIYSAGIQSVSMEFGVSEVAATLGLTLFVAGYGVGPLIWAPMSEIPQIGRNPVYILTLFIFVVLQVPTALAVNFGMLLAFRFITGFVGSPVLATGGASIGDMYRPQKRAYGIAIWGIAAVCGPVMGPVVGGWAAMFEGKQD